MPAPQALAEPQRTPLRARRHRKGTRKPYGFRPSSGSTYTTLSLALVAAMALAAARDAELVRLHATTYNVGAGFAIAYAGQLAYVALLNRSRFRSWAARTYGLGFSWGEAHLLLRGRGVRDIRAAVTGGLTFLHSTAGELPRLEMPTMEIPVVAASAERG